MSNSWFDTLGVFDLETTGIDVETARIVSAHVGVIDSTGALVEQHDWLADPGVEIPEGASAVHGITTARARAEGRPAGVVIAEIIAVLSDLFSRGLAVTIYNAPYDLSLLHHEALRNGLEPLVEPAPIIDPLVLDRVVDRYRKGKRTLEAAAVVYGVDLQDAHDASADAVAAGRVAQAMARKHPDQLAIESALLHSQQIAWCRRAVRGFPGLHAAHPQPELHDVGALADPLRRAPANVLTALHRCLTRSRRRRIVEECVGESGGQRRSHPSVSCLSCRSLE